MRYHYVVKTVLQLRRPGRYGRQAPEATLIHQQADRVRLIDLPAGIRGRVCGISGRGDNAERLKVMGVCLGRMVSVIRRGDPMIVRVWGTRIGISARLAAQVLIEVPPPQQGGDGPRRDRHRHGPADS